MSDAAPDAPSPSAPFPAPQYASQRSRPREIEGSVLEWSNWRLLTAKVAKVNAWVGAATGAITVAVMILFTASAMGFSGAMVGLLFALLIGPLFGYLAGLITAYLEMWFLFWPVRLTLRVLQWDPLDEHVALTGGALLALLWALPLVFDPTPLGVFEIAFSVLGLAINILAGQAGAVLALVERFRRPATNETGATRLPRFSMRTLLAVMIPICVTLTLFRWLGLLRVETLVIILAWLVLQYYLRTPATRLTLWWLDRQAKKREARLPRPDVVASGPASETTG